MVCFSRALSVKPLLKSEASFERRFHWQTFANQLQNSDFAVPSGVNACSTFNQPWNGEKKMKLICEDAADICEAYFWTGTQGPDGKWNVAGDCDEMCAKGGGVCLEAWDQSPDPGESCTRNIPDSRRVGNGCSNKYNNQICRCLIPEGRFACDRLLENLDLVGKVNTFAKNCDDNHTNERFSTCEALFKTENRTCKQQCALAGMDCAGGWDQRGENSPDGNPGNDLNTCTRFPLTQAQEDNENGCNMQFYSQICQCEFPGATSPP